MSDINIKREDNGHDGRFVLYKDNHYVGEMHYDWLDDHTMIIDHTGVEPQYEGHQYGKDLVQSGVEFAQKNNLKIIPLCPFAKALIERNPSWQDVLY